MRRRNLILGAVAAVSLIFAVLFVVQVIRDNLPSRDQINFGVTFAKRQAEYLGLDWKETYRAILDDLGVRRLRLAAYWDEIEPSPGKFNWDDLDWQLREAERAKARVILGVGRRLPRWPECHVPAWAQNLPEDQQRLLTLSAIRAIVLHAKDSPALEVWQVENEPLLDSFGVCPPGDRAFLEQEIALVRELDPNHPVMTTESGELSSWVGAADLVDVLGISLYRLAWNQFFGTVYYPLTPGFYRRKAEAVRILGPKIIITELQAEPWNQKPLAELTVEEQFRTRNPERVRRNIEFARLVGLPEVYLWGAEWWYWLKQHGRPEIWNETRDLFSK